ncbi:MULTISPECIES: LysR family transcriptional regulator [Kitasatospora]|uniref:Putative LysR family transcriptional regulator n=1 Tax=Kitasatospora setae (strain ATCC 33774 / DSM 43861 / JCM 3304 / KCC A-0304 / NBRC 14216 / KM-6054) TaxID=452652 RepID=E4N0U7_KITSK|nr:MULTISPECIES: LysR family transcriptional regulator [Kitasatospora]BAJ31781.1 putative LysR family transcriptional regulator [Kitasatospora setae KM-6054]
MDLELRHLRVLCAIADSGSVGRAAAAIGASQPATSTQLRRIERYLGAVVFDRTAAGVVPTTFGAEVLAAAREVLSRVDRLGQGAAPDGERPHRELLLATDCPALLPGALTRARQLRPELRFALTPGRPGTAPGFPEPDGGPPFDLALLLDHPGSGLRPTPALAARAVATEPVFVALPTAHPLRHHAEPALTDLAGETWLLPAADGASWPALFRAACEAAAFSPAGVRELPYGRREVLDLVASGLGAALVPASTAPVPGVTVKPLLGTPLWLRYVLLWQRATIGPGLAHTLLEATAAAYRELAAEAPHLHSWASRTFRPPRV